MERGDFNHFGYVQNNFCRNKQISDIFSFFLYFLRIRGHAKRSRSTVSPQCISRQQQLNKSIELSKPKPRGGVNPSPGSNSTPGPPGKGPRIAKPVSRCVL